MERIRKAFRKHLGAKGVSKNTWVFKKTAKNGSFVPAGRWPNLSSVLTGLSEDIDIPDIVLERVKDIDWVSKRERISKTDLQGDNTLDMILDLRRELTDQDEAPLKVSEIRFLGWLLEMCSLLPFLFRAILPNQERD